jgi:hypothetical protein
MLIVVEYASIVLSLIVFSSRNVDLIGLIWYLTLVYLLAAVVLVIFASWRGRSAAVGWGNYVRASHDIFLPELGKILRFPPATRKQQNRLRAEIERQTSG